MEEIKYVPLNKFQIEPTLDDKFWLEKIKRSIDECNSVGALKEIGIKYWNPASKTTPIPWFNKHSDTSKKQTALQENESTNYVIGVMGDTLNYDELPVL